MAGIFNLETSPISLNPRHKIVCHTTGPLKNWRVLCLHSRAQPAREYHLNSMGRMLPFRESKMRSSEYLDPKTLVS